LDGNLISIVLIILTLVEAYKKSWYRPKFNSIATIAVLWFLGSLGLFLIGGK
jgi:hypothetical protein